MILAGFSECRQAGANGGGQPRHPGRVTDSGCSARRDSVKRTGQNLAAKGRNRPGTSRFPELRDAGRDARLRPRRGRSRV